MKKRVRGFFDKGSRERLFMRDVSKGEISNKGSLS